MEKPRNKKAATKETVNHEDGFSALVGLFEQTQTAMQTQAARSVDLALVVRNWLFGWYIVEFEGGGADRVDLYGKNLINSLSQKLEQSNIKGMSPTNLRKFREFYNAFSEIRQAVPVTSFLEHLSLLKIQQAVPVTSYGTPALLPVFNALKQRFKLHEIEADPMSTLQAKEYNSFEAIMHVSEDGSEFWYARELAPVLEYVQWRNFAKVLDRAMLACKNSNYVIADHFAEVSKIVEAGATRKPVVDFKLSNG